MKVVAVCMSAGAIAWFTFDTRGRTGLQMDYYSQHEMWPEVLETADRMPRGLYNIRCNRNVMLALYHTGRLGDEMFRYPQAPGDVRYQLLSPAKDPHTHVQESRLFLGLGQVNLAEKCAYEALVMTGDLPWILKQLAVINVVKDQPETAKMFLSALSNKPLHRRAAEEMLRRLAEDPRLESDVQIRQMRRSVGSKDMALLTVNNEQALLRLLKENPDNKMAFEFLMAHYLRNVRPDKVVENLQHLERFGYGRIPRHFQEAILVHASRTSGLPPRIEREMAPETRTRASMFSEIVTSSRSREEAMQRAAEAGLGDSYFFYYSYGKSGL